MHCLVHWVGAHGENLLPTSSLSTSIIHIVLCASLVFGVRSTHLVQTAVHLWTIDMAEVLGAVSSVLTIATVTLDLSRSAYNIVTSFESQRKDVDEIRSDLSTLTVILGQIQQQVEGLPDDGRLQPLREPLQCCQAISQEIHDMLEKCMRHSKDKRESVRTWLKLRYREKGFTDAKQRLASYKSTLAIAFDTMKMRDHKVTQESLDGLEKLVAQTREELEDQFEQVQQAIHTADTSMRAILASDRAQIRSCLDSLEQTQEIRENVRAQIVVLGNIAGPNSRLIAGTDSLNSSFNLSVRHNEAREGASMAAGVYTPEVLKALLQQSSAPPGIVALFQATQKCGVTLDPQAVQDLLQGRSLHCHQSESTQKRF